MSGSFIKSTERSNIWPVWPEFLTLLSWRFQHLFFIGCLFRKFHYWLTAVCPCLTCSSWTRQVIQFRDGRAGEQNTSSSENVQWIRRHIFKPTLLDVEWYRHRSSLWPRVLFLCPDSRAEYVFPQPLPVLMICSAWWVINESWVAAVIQSFEPVWVLVSPRPWFQKASYSKNILSEGILDVQKHTNSAQMETIVIPYFDNNSNNNNDIVSPIWSHLCFVLWSFDLWLEKRTKLLNCFFCVALQQRANHGSLKENTSDRWPHWLFTVPAANVCISLTLCHVAY